jgi:fucose permease
MILSETAAAATFGLIVSVSQLGGVIGPYVIGYLNDKTHSLLPAFGFIAMVYLAAASLALAVRVEQPRAAWGGERPQTA